MSDYIPQDTASGYGRHDLGKPPQPYTLAEVKEVALRNSDNDWLACVYGEVDGLEDEYWIIEEPIDAVTLKTMARSIDGNKVIPVHIDDREGLFYID